MVNLQNIIEGNIEFFWNTDPIVWYDAENGCYRDKPLACDGETVDKFWIAFRDWCVENCKEVYEENNKHIEESIIEEAVLANFDKWLNWNK